MRRPSTFLRRGVRPTFLQKSIRCISSAPPIINIQNGTFYRQHPSPKASPQSNNPPIYPNLNFVLPSTPATSEDASDPQNLQHWGIIGSSGRTTFLKVLQGQYIAIPPETRSYPYLASNHRVPSSAIGYVGFADEGPPVQGNPRGAYMSARYESRREDTDFTLLDHLKGRTSLNPMQGEEDGTLHDDVLLNRVISSLNLEELLNLPFGKLSNGQTRRAKIANVLLRSPEVLLIDEPFMGVDPITREHLSKVLYNLASKSSPRLIISLRPQDTIPDWLTHLVILGNDNHVSLQGEKTKILRQLRLLRTLFNRGLSRKSSASRESAKKKKPSMFGLPNEKDEHHRKDAGINSRHRLELPNPRQEIRYQNYSSEDKAMYDKAESQHEKGILDLNHYIDFGITSKKYWVPPNFVSASEPVVELSGVRVKYGDKTVLGDWKQNIQNVERPGMFWKICRGERWGVFGPNGSGKTTLLSLITSDHPQAYSLPLTIFGHPRLPKPGEPGISIFDLQSRIGHSSPEMHSFFPRHLSIRQSVESAYADTFLSKPKLDYQKDLDVDASLSFFEEDLNPRFVPWFEQKEHPRLSPRELKAPPSKEDVVLLSTLRKAYSAKRINLSQDPASLDWADNIIFSELSIPQQRIVLFIRAVVHKPDLIVLDEAFSGMSSSTRDKCIHFLEVGERSVRSSSRSVLSPSISRSTRLSSTHIRHRGLSEDQALITISHDKDEIPGIVRHWMYLPGPDEGESGKRPFRTGRLDEKKTLSSDDAWDLVWHSAERKTSNEGSEPANNQVSC